MKVCVECGQRWWRLSSWYRSYPNKKYYPKARKIIQRDVVVGWAFGPIMLFKKRA